ncbi:MAG: hypothetical protein IJ557_06385 [Bacteroidaceae bacterium]|nr:hypothetical protein [Bacteroidaceae bacterium]
MRKNTYYYMAILLAGLIIVACSSDDEPKTNGYTIVTVGEAPSWQVDWQGNDPRPDWQEPNIQEYENWSIMKIQIEDALKSYTSIDDRLALFVADECRGVQGPAVLVGSTETNTTIYLLKAWGNEDDGQQLLVTLKYYNARLKQVFARTATITYHLGKELGVDEDLIPQFTLGSTKYPVVTSFNPTALLTKAAVTPAIGDIVAAFVGDECRGVGRWTSDNLPLTILGRSEGESVSIRYFQAATGNIYTFPDAFKTNTQLTTSIKFD